MNPKAETRRWYSRSQVDNRRTSLNVHVVFLNPRNEGYNGVVFSRATSREMRRWEGTALAGNRYSVSHHTCHCVTDDFAKALRAFIRAVHDARNESRARWANPEARS